jgi:hypothetical protein
LENKCKFFGAGIESGVGMVVEVAYSANFINLFIYIGDIAYGLIFFDCDDLLDTAFQNLYY